MRRAVDQPGDIQVNYSSGEVRDPQRHPRVLVPSIDRHDSRQAQSEDRVQDFVVTAN